MLEALFVTFVVLVIFIGGVVQVTKNRRIIEAMTGGGAISGYVDYDLIMGRRFDELKPLVDRVGIILRGVRESNNRYESARVYDTFEIFVTDINGVVHDLATVEDQAEAVAMATRLATKLEVELDDPGHVVRGSLTD